MTTFACPENWSTEYDEYVRWATHHIHSFQFPIIGVAMSYGAGRADSIPGSGKIFFSTPQRPDPLWGPPSLLSNGYRGVKQQGREADHSPPSSAEVKNGGVIPPLKAAP
jgi:hypothetical protein